MDTRDEMTAALREEPQPAPARPFVHLHTHSAYSLLEGAVPLAKLMGLATTDGQPALAITDRSNLFGALEFSSKAAKEGLQPIIGCTLEIDFDDQSEGSRSGSTQQAMVAFPTLVLLASNEDGYQNLIRLVSLAYMEGAVESRAHITLAQLIEHNDGLIVLTGGPDGPIDGMIADDHPAEALARLQSLQKAFGDRRYIELQRQAGYSPKREGELLDMAYNLGIGIVATNEVFFAKRDDFDAHDTLICIAEGRMVSEDDRRRLTPDHYLKSTAEMNLLFADLPEAIDNTTIIAQRCAFAVQELDPILPFFTGGKGDAPLAAEAAELRRQAIEGLKARLATHPLAKGYTREQYDERLEFELSVIENMKFQGNINLKPELSDKLFTWNLRMTVFCIACYLTPPCNVYKYLLGFRFSFSQCV